MTRYDTVEYDLGILPKPLDLARALLRWPEPFVMVNLLAFRPQAQGRRFAGMTGREAYLRYANSVEKVQAPLGSKMLLTANVTEALGLPAGTQGPGFDAFALLQYASPLAFLRFALAGGSDTRARSAGLEGQWLFAATPQEDQTVAMPEGGELLVEVTGPCDDRASWRATRAEAHRPYGAVSVWRGRTDRQVLGRHTPRVREVAVTWFPDRSSLDDALARSGHGRDPYAPVPWWAWCATPTHLLPGLR